MMHGYGLVKKLCAELKDFMKVHNFSSIEDFRGYALQLRANFMNKTTSGTWKFTHFHVFLVVSQGFSSVFYNSHGFGTKATRSY